MIVQPVINESTGEVVAKTSFLSPHFEEGRVRMLGIPSAESLDIITWEEHWNPYLALKNSLFAGQENPTLMIDEELRDFLTRGLGAAGFKTVALSGAVEAVRQTKTTAEIELLRAVNTGTVNGIRAMRPCLEPGLTENQVIRILDTTMLSIGFESFFDIVLFDGNAALPHGGFETGNAVLAYETMVLIDVGYHYLGYSSDVCRSFLINPPGKTLMGRLLEYTGLPVGGSAVRSDELHQEKVKVWDIVFQAQTAAAKMFVPNNTAASVDVAARTVIDEAGYDGTFTHRVGHGIGIKGTSRHLLLVFPRPNFVVGITKSIASTRITVSEQREPCNTSQAKHDFYQRARHLPRRKVRRQTRRCISRKGEWRARGAQWEAGCWSI